MAEWITCPTCQLRHSARVDGLCPRCREAVQRGSTAPASDEPFAAAAEPHPAPDPGPAGGGCQLCGARAMTQRVTFRQNVGVIVLFFTRKLEGELCARCVDATFRQMTLITGLAGWWGVISFFITPFMLIWNLAEYTKARAGFRAGAAAGAGRTAAAPTVASTHTLAIASFLIGLGSVVLCSGLGMAALAGAVLGTIALGQIRRSPDRYSGTGLAAAGVGLSLVSLVAFGVVVYLVATAAPEPPDPTGARAAWRAADARLTGYRGEEAFGNTEQAREMAARLATLCGAVGKLAGAGSRRSGLSLSEGHCLTHVEIREGRVCFLVHVPELRRYREDTRLSLFRLLWKSARQITKEAGAGGETELALALRGAFLYGAVGTGSLEDTAPPVPDTAPQGSPPSGLEPFFAGPLGGAATNALAAPGR